VELPSKTVNRRLDFPYANNPVALTKLGGAGWASPRKPILKGELEFSNRLVLAGAKTTELSYDIRRFNSRARQKQSHFLLLRD